MAALAVACGGDDDDSASEDDSGSGSVTEISLTMKEGDALAFYPAEIEVRAGEPLRITMNNPGSAVHDFAV